jgi:hypothetical protein
MHVLEYMMMLMRVYAHTMVLVPMYVYAHTIPVYVFGHGYMLPYTHVRM